MRTPSSVSMHLDTEIARADRRLTGATEWFWYVVAAVSYILCGIWNKWLLNWLLGPIWLVAVICLGPPLATWMRMLIFGRLIASRLIGRR